MISESQMRYASRVPCHGRSWRPCVRCQRMIREENVAAMPPLYMRGGLGEVASVAHFARRQGAVAPRRRVVRGLAGLDGNLHAREIVVELRLRIDAERLG